MHLLVRRAWPVAGTAERVLRVWQEREIFLKALERLPHTLAHLDLFKLNFFAVPGVDGSDETVAIDWSFLGTAAVGEELASLVCMSVTIGGDHADRVRDLGELAFACYLEGLREAGWSGDARLARLGYAGGPVRLFSCQTGRDTNSIAKSLADQIGDLVMAPRDTIFVRRNGSFYVGPQKNVPLPSADWWRRFTPGDW